VTTPEDVPSPCLQICDIDPERGWCRGCGRSLAEIEAWPTATADERRVILARLGERMSRFNGSA
jgi:predicted Fe-S protein YdhL (DUF1289 family)